LKLFEYEAKQVYARYCINIPKSALVSSTKQAHIVVQQLKAPYVAKAQVLTGGRGKKGGIQFAKTAKEIQKIVSALLQSTINGLPVSKVLVEEKLSVTKELFIAATIERSNRTYMVLASAQGGVAIEDLALRNPELIIN
jgi:succinyl-CoA synthetase beta subunit